MKKKIKNMLVIFFLVCSILSGLFITNPNNTVVAAWWDGNWNSYREITIESDYIDENLHNFTILVPIADAIADLCDGGDSIRFLSTDNTTEFNYEIENWTDGADRLVWVNISETITSGSDYTFLMYYNNSAAADNQNPSGTWNSNYIMVQHLNESGANTRVDSTSYNNDATRNGGITSIQGKIGSGNLFNGTLGGNLTITHDASQQLSEFTVAMWINSNNLAGTQDIIHKGHSDTNYRNYQIAVVTSRYYGVYQAIGGGASSPVLSDGLTTGDWRYVVFSFKNDTGTPTSNIYVNTTNPNTTTDVVVPKITQTTDLVIGYMSSAGWTAFNGTLDEIQISNVRRNESWINASFHTQNQSTHLGSFITFGAEIGVTSSPPTNFATATESITSINVTWTMGINATHTRVQRNTGSYPTSISDGTNIYNGTGTYYLDSSLTSYTRYYYRAWSYNSTSGDWSGYTSSTNNTGPTNPTSVAASMVVNDLNISWVVGTDADTTLIQRRTDSTYPTGPTDGTNIYNSTGTYHIDANALQTYYYTMFSWDNNTNLYSSGFQVLWGSLVVNCFDEETNDSLTFDIFISNHPGDDTYYQTRCSNPTAIDVNELPLGDGISIKISANESYANQSETFTGYNREQNRSTTYVILLVNPNSKYNTNLTCKNTTSGGNFYPPFTLSNDLITIIPDACGEFDTIIVNYTHDTYEDRFYNRDFEANHFYSLNAYLPPIDTTDVSFYILTVQSELNEGVNDARLVFSRYLSFVGEYTTVSSIHTDASGKASIYLIPGEIYKVNISATGHTTTTFDYIPPEDDPYYTFELPFTEIEPQAPFVYMEEITFNGYISGTTLYVNYTDALNVTTNSQIFVYELNTSNGNRTLIGSNSVTTDADYQYTLTGINTSNAHIIVLHHNHTEFGHQTQSFTIEADYTPFTTPGTLETLLNAIIGTNPLGWGNLLIWLFFTVAMFHADQRDAGKILVLIGGLFLFINIAVGFNTTLLTVAGGAIPLLFIVVGIIAMWNDSRRVRA